MTDPFLPPRGVALPATGGRIGSDLEDFRVAEVPLYLPCGEGEHVYVHLEKRGLTTPQLLTHLARATGVKERDIGCAGMKDKHGITRQWVSVPATQAPPVVSWELPDGVTVLEESRHTNKLRTGHQAGNRFQIRIVEAEDASAGSAIRTQLQRDGLLNYFGAQRFGRGLDNTRKALQWLRAGARGRGKSARFYRKLYPSVIQSEIFNRYTARRVALGMDMLLPGEVVRLQGSSSMFVVEDVSAELPRLVRKDISHTGPMPGAKMLPARGDAAELEQTIIREMELSADDLEALGQQAPGTRRDLTVRVDDLEFTQESSATFVLSFQLPSGGYATQLVREFTAAPYDDDGRGSASPSA